MTASLRGRVLSVIMAVAVALGLAVVAGGTQQAHAAHRDWLRTDNTGTCEWDPVWFWVQRCDVWSPSMNRNIPVQIQPAKNGGNAGFYLLDGMRATDATSGWVSPHTAVNAAKTYADHNITLVMPAGGESSFYADWQAPGKYDPNDPVNYKWETFLTSELPAYLEQNFGVARNNNAIAGLSMGAGSAMTLAAKHTDQFKQVLSFSGYLTMTVPGAQTVLRLAMLDSGGFNVNAMYGSLFNPKRFQNDPLLLIPQLRDGGTDVYISAATGIPGQLDRETLPPEFQAPGIALEVGSLLTTRAWEGAARLQGLNPTVNYPAEGLHNWYQWDYQLNASKPRVLTVMNAW